MSKPRVSTFRTLDGVRPAAHAAPVERLREEESDGNRFAT